MNHIVKIYCWAEISAQNKLQFSFTFGFRVVFVKKKSFLEGYFGTLLRPKFFMEGVKIQSWAGLLGKNRL